MQSTSENSLKSTLNIPDDWQQLGTDLKHETKPGSLMIIGDADTGKTTLARYLFQILRNRFRTALLDADLGQSQVGPPATVGLLPFATKDQKRREPILKFVGNTSPKACFLQLLTAVKGLSERATGMGINRTIIDSCGMVHGQAPREFKYNLITILKPLTVIALEKKPRELEQLLLPFKTDPEVQVHRLEIPPDLIAPKSAQERRNFRREKFQQYFQSAENQEISTSNQGLCGHIPDLSTPNKISNLLIGLCDQRDDLLTLGQLKGYDPEQQRLCYFAPSTKSAQVKRIHFGLKRLDLSV